MAININTISVGGSVLIWLGVIICLGGFAFFWVVSSGISPDRYAEGWPLHDTYFILLHWKHRLIFLLPLLAGLILVASGLLIRRQVPTLQSMLTSVPVQNQEAEGEEP
jgi:hypothetical protein